MAYPYGYTGYTPQYQQQYPQQPMQTPMQQQVQSPQHIVRPDTANGYIYTKQLNLQTGCADFVAYSRVQMQETNKPSETDLSKFVPRSEFDELKARFNTLCDKLGGNEA